MPRLQRHLALLCAALFALPAAAHAQSTGGTAYPDTTVAQDGSLSARGTILLGRVMHVRGTLADAGGQTIVIERRKDNGPWQQAATVQADDSGTFDAAWRTDHIGHFALRALVAGQTPPQDGAAAAAAVPTRDVTVYRQTVATWFGPGLYGRQTACGQTLTRTLLGVAHRTLPCGAQVALLYRGRTITVPVVDRGPFGHGADFDLTAATALALGLTTTAPIGAVRIG
jgi:rare lipoprotein A (peptidoglycan hydrolase)